ncbi:hypothetical protein Tco_1062418 [Tanacetum coccineum]
MKIGLIVKDEETMFQKVKRKLLLTQRIVKHLLKTGHQTVKTVLVKNLGQRDLGIKGGSRETRPVWNNIQRVNHSNFSRNSRYPHQRRSFIPSAVLTRDGLISTARPTMTQTVPSKSTANVTCLGGRISGKGTIKTSCLDFEKVSYVEELKFNLLSVSQICDKKHNVLFTDKECLILSPKFKFVDEDLLKRQQMMKLFYGTEDWGMSNIIKNINKLFKAIWLEVYPPRHSRLIIRVLHVTRETTQSSCKKLKKELSYETY